MAAAGTADAESFWSLSDWSFKSSTGLETKTEPLPVLVPGPGFAAEAAVATARTAIAIPTKRPWSGLVRSRIVYRPETRVAP